MSGPLSTAEGLGLGGGRRRLPREVALHWVLAAGSLSPKEVAARFGVSKATLCRYLGGASDT